MRRGLMKWDPAELPQEILAARAQRMQAAMAAAGFDALVVYTNNVRPAAVTYLTAFTPYWSDAILLLPSRGPSIFATSLSKRVVNWIRSTNPVSDIITTPRPGAVVGEHLAADRNVRRVGVLEFDMLPFGIFDDLARAAPGVEFADATAEFASVRQFLDAAEIGLIEKADALARQALAPPASGRTAGEYLGLVEATLRDEGAEEVYLAVVADMHADSSFVRNPGASALGNCVAVSASVALKGCWVRRTRSFAGDAVTQRLFDRAQAWWDGDGVRLQAAQPIGRQVCAAVARLPGARLLSWSAHGSRGSYPLQAIASASADAPAPANSLVVLSVTLEIDGVKWLAAAPMIIDAN